MNTAPTKPFEQEVKEHISLSEANAPKTSGNEASTVAMSSLAVSTEITPVLFGGSGGKKPFEETKESVSSSGTDAPKAAPKCQMAIDSLLHIKINLL
jgi:hypothetical protein